MNSPKYASVDDLQAQTTLHDAAAKCGIALDVVGSGKQVRIDCPFNCAGDHAGRREISVDTSNPQKVFACHAYGCQVRGNLLTLMHGCGAAPEHFAANALESTGSRQDSLRPHCGDGDSLRSHGLGKIH